MLPRAKYGLRYLLICLSNSYTLEERKREGSEYGQLIESYIKVGQHSSNLSQSLSLSLFLSQKNTQKNAGSWSLVGFVEKAVLV